MTVTYADILAAAARIEGQVERTPTRCSRTLSKITGAEIWVKFDNLQFTASFKERGALNRLSLLTADERRRGVIAAVFIVLVAVLCAYLVFHFTSSRYSASELHSTNSVARTCVHGESSCMHTVSQNI